MRLVQLPFTSAHCILNNAGTSMLIVELELVAKDGLFRYEISNFVKMVFYKVGGFLPKHSILRCCMLFTTFK